LILNNEGRKILRDSNTKKAISKKDKQWSKRSFSVNSLRFRQQVFPFYCVRS